MERRSHVLSCKRVIFKSLFNILVKTAMSASPFTAVAMFTSLTCGG